MINKRPSPTSHSDDLDLGFDNKNDRKPSSSQRQECCGSFYKGIDILQIRVVEPLSIWYQNFELE